MIKIILNATVLDQLQQAQRSVELCDEQGRSVGYFVPKSPPSSEFSSGPQISAEELARRKREGGFVSTAELLKRLESH